MNPFDSACQQVQELVAAFQEHESHYLSPTYQEAEVRKDFIDKFFIALGWDVNHEQQQNPYQQEVKVERGVAVGAARRRADYGFHIAPNFRDPRFMVEAKKPARDPANRQFLSLCPIRLVNFTDPADKARHDRMVSLVEQMLDAKQHAASAKTDRDRNFYAGKCAHLDKQIDALVYELYGLTAEEIAIV